MAAPATAFKFEAQMDPKELLDYQLKLRDNPKLLEEGETFTLWTLTLSPEAVALGLEIGTGVYVPTDDGTDIVIWFQINEAFQEDPAFDGAGSRLAMELYIETDNVPPRKRQRTIILEVVQQ